MSLFQDLDELPATIATGQALSGQVNLAKKSLVGISMPATWTTAPITFSVSPDGGTTWQNLYDGAGNEVTVTASANQFIPMDATIWKGIECLMVRSGPNASPVNQSAQAVVNLMVRGVF
jgi:hypothetical protein